MPTSANLQNAKIAKKDEFYTQINDIENEMDFYKDHFKDKVVFCNCDDHESSSFYQFFKLGFEHLGLKKLIATHFSYDKKEWIKTYEDEELEIPKTVPNDLKVFRVDYDGVNEVKTELERDGDFRSPECMKILKEEADIVITNPPFSLFRDFVKTLMENNKHFIIMGNVNAASTKEVRPYFANGSVWFGSTLKSKTAEFQVPDHYPLETKGSRVDEDGNKFIKVNGVRWYTNLDHEVRNENIYLARTYSEKKYPKYENYDAIEVKYVAEIPEDYFGEMGVPITFLDKHNPNQFEIVGFDRDLDKINGGKRNERFKMNGKELYARIIVKRK